MVRIQKLDSQKWETLSEDAHRAVFGELKPKHFDRISYVFLALDDDKPVGYVSIRETDHETVYWQFGGAFDWARNTSTPVRCYDAFIETQKSLGTKRVTTKIENTNITMLKLAMSRGFLILGSGYYQGSVLLDLVKEF